MKIKIMKSDKTEEEIQNVEAVIYDLPEKKLKIHYRSQDVIYLSNVKTLDFSLDNILAFMVNKS